MKSRNRRMALLAALPILLAGCAASADDLPSDTSPGASGMSMAPGMAMHPGMRAGPSDAARMVCSDEIRESIAQTLGLSGPPTPRASWHDSVYTCTYRLSTGALVLSVKDSSTAAAGQAYFSTREHRTVQAERLHGLASLGLPSFETNDGIVAFLKDGKTLTVDATNLPVDAGPGHQSRSDVAYAIAADVVACWSE